MDVQTDGQIFRWMFYSLRQHSRTNNLVLANISTIIFNFALSGALYISKVSFPTGHYRCCICSPSEPFAPVVFAFFFFSRYHDSNHSSDLDDKKFSQVLEHNLGHFIRLLFIKEEIWSYTHTYMMIHHNEVGFISGTHRLKIQCNSIKSMKRKTIISFQSMKKMNDKILLPFYDNKSQHTRNTKKKNSPFIDNRYPQTN